MVRFKTVVLFAFIWYLVKISTFAKDWDGLTITFVALVGLLIANILIEISQRLKERGRQDLLFKIVMTCGVITVILDQFHIGWYGVPGPVGRTLMAIGTFIALLLCILRLLSMKKEDFE